MTDKKLYELAALRACRERHSWQDIAGCLGVSWQTARGQWRRKCQDLEPGPCPLCGPGEACKKSWKEQGNYASASVAGDSPLTLDEFCDLLHVDSDVWLARDWEASTWQQGVNRRGHLDFNEGVLDGHLDYFPEVVDLWSHRATFVRREPVALQPVIQPVECPMYFSVQPRPTPSPDVVRSALLISDLHMGYERDNRSGRLVPLHDRRALDAVLQLASNWLFDYIAIIGDLLDLTNWNDKYLRSPEFYWTTQPSLLEAHWFLRNLRQLQRSARIVLFQGNHEERMGKALQKHLMEAHDLRAADEMELPPALSPQRLLALHRLGIDWVPGEEWLGVLRLTHGEVARKPPGASTRAAVEDSQCDTAFGHTHKLEIVSKRVRVPGGTKVIKSMSTGCLCHVDGRVPPHGPPEQWQQGFATVTYTEERWTPTLVSLDEGRAVVGSYDLQGTDYTGRLQKDLPDWNWR